MNLLKKNNHFNINEYEQEAEIFLSELLEEEYLIKSGLKNNEKPKDIYKQHPELFSLQVIKKLKKELNQEKKTKYLYEFAIAFSFQEKLKSINNQIVNEIVNTVIKHNNTCIHYYQLPSAITKEKNQKQRHNLFNLFMKETEKLNTLKIRQFNHIKEHTINLGYSDYTKLNNETRDGDFVTIEKMMRKFVDKTKDLYFCLVKNQLTNLDISYKDALVCDLQYALNDEEFNKYFNKNRLFPILNNTLSNLGIDFNKQNILLDIKEHKSKSPRPFCSPIKVPFDIRICISPSGGFSDYRAILHEVGHAEHYCHINPKLSFSYKLLGDNGIHEAYAFLFENLCFNINWHKHNRTLKNTTYFMEVSNLIRINMLRVFAAKILYEQKLFRFDNICEAKTLYSDVFSKYAGVKYDDRNFLFDVDIGFNCVNYLRGWMLEAHLSYYLKINYGKYWFCTKEAGRFLVNLWEQGLEHEMEIIIKDILGFKKIDISILLSEIKI